MPSWIGLPGPDRNVAPISNQHCRASMGAGKVWSIPQPPPPRALKRAEPSVWRTEQRTHKLRVIRHCSQLPRVGSRRQIFCLSSDMSEVKPDLWRTQQETHKKNHKTMWICCSAQLKLKSLIFRTFWMVWSYYGIYSNDLNCLIVVIEIGLWGPKCFAFNWKECHH